MSEEVKGVFVRLPLSDEQRMVANEAPYKSDRKGSALEASILAIGTPVTGSDLKPVGKVAGHFSDGQPMVRILDRPNLPYETEIALYSDAQAQIAALEAEIARLQTKQTLYDRMVQENGELKLAVARLQRPEFYGTESQDIGSDDISSLFYFCEDNEVIEINGYRCVSTQFGFFDGTDVHLYGSEDEALSAAKALKGPEA